MAMTDQPCNPKIRLVGDPVDVVTAANMDISLQFKLPGPITLFWRHYYNSRDNRVQRALGWGHSHEFDRWLKFDLDGMRYLTPDGLSVAFPTLGDDGDWAHAAGFTLCRVTLDRYRIMTENAPFEEFSFSPAKTVSPLRRLQHGQHVIVFQHDTDDRLELIKDAAGRSMRVVCDDAGRVSALGLIDTNGGIRRKLMAYQYDDSGNLKQCVDPYGHLTSYSYDRQNRMTRKKDKRGYAFYYQYDKNGRCITSEGEDGLHRVNIQYLPQENTSVVTKDNKGQWVYLFNDSGTITQIIDPYGGKTSFTLNQSGRVVSEIDPAGNQTQWIYNSAGALAGKVSSLGRFETHPQQPDDLMPFEHRLPSCPCQWEYGDLLVTQTPPVKIYLGETTQDEPVEKLNHQTLEVYDELGLLVKEQTAAKMTRRWQYDPNGNIARYTDRDHSKYRFHYTSWNLFGKEENPLGHEVRLDYTHCEEIRQVKDALDNTSEYKYDLKDRLLEVWRNGSLKEQYRYDSADNLIEKLDAEGNILLEIKIGANNLIEERKLASGESQHFEYDQKGRYVGLQTDQSSVKMAYDGWGNRILDQRDGLGVRHEFRGKRISKSTLFDKFITRYTYRSDGGVSIEDPGGQVHHFLRPENRDGNAEIRKNLSNGIREITVFDSQGKCLSKQVEAYQTDVSGWRREYRYSGEGDLLAAYDNHSGETRYEYDRAHRLIGKIGKNGRKEAYAYDRAGNLLQHGRLDDVELMPGNRIAKANGQRIQYNNRFAVETIVEGNAKKKYLYDSRDMLRRIEKEGQPHWQAAYDAIGRRLFKVFGPSRTDFYWDTDRLAAEIDSSGKLRIYLYPDAFAMVPFLIMEYEDIEDDPGSATRFFVFSDHIGSPTTIVDENGNVVWRAKYDPYGEAHVDENSRVDMPLRFPGHYFDRETGLNYNRFRYYHPRWGRYLQSDPAGIGGGYNLYSPTTNPLKDVDLRGLGCPRHRTSDPECEDCQANETTRVFRRPTPDPATTRRAGNPTAVKTHRQTELPYHNPPEMHVVRPGRPLDVNSLNPNRRYLWAVNADGDVIIAPERQGRFGANQDYPNGRRVKHGDLIPGAGGQARGIARSGGELNYDANTGTWVMDNNSSYTFARLDGRRGTGDNLLASHDLLSQSGTDTSNIDCTNTHGTRTPTW